MSLLRGTLLSRLTRVISLRSLSVAVLPGRTTVLLTAVPLRLLILRRDGLARVIPLLVLVLLSTVLLPIVLLSVYLLTIAVLTRRAVLLIGIVVALLRIAAASWCRIALLTRSLSAPLLSLRSRSLTVLSVILGNEHRFFVVCIFHVFFFI